MSRFFYRFCYYFIIILYYLLNGVNFWLKIAKNWQTGSKIVKICRKSGKNAQKWKLGIWNVKFHKSLVPPIYPILSARPYGEARGGSFHMGRLGREGGVPYGEAREGGVDRWNKRLVKFDISYAELPFLAFFCHFFDIFINSWQFLSKIDTTLIK